jgi:hypothetical protein
MAETVVSDEQKGRVQQRLALALRANLARRKAQKREREALAKKHAGSKAPQEQTASGDHSKEQPE